MAPTQQAFRASRLVVAVLLISSGGAAFANKCCTELNLFQQPAGAAAPVYVRSFPVPGDDGIPDPGAGLFFTCTQQPACVDKQGACAPAKTIDKITKKPVWNCYCVIDPKKGCKTRRRSRALLQTETINCCSAGIGDPHFTSLQGQGYDFQGFGGASFCLLSQHNMHINARFIAGAAANSTQTWMDALSLMTVGADGASHTLELSLGQVVSEDAWTVRFDDAPVALPDPSATWLDDVIHLEREESHRLTLLVKDRVCLEIFVLYDENIAPVELPDRPYGGRYLNFQISMLVAANDAHGVLGQTVRPTGNGASIVEGKDLDYVTSSLTSSDCTFDRYRGDRDDLTATNARQVLSVGLDGHEDETPLVTFSSGNGIKWSVSVADN
ncbi:hypothetical protein KFL_000920370 [Klebsormidium nitens]|uniref:Uncharacterized protein n=1 Tax=Klebsormidium nitens TaxID=105231 RepID=A0A0U9HUI7_KLENI|nr:hypothetical protein KFL_000920370 [Klebsormidium nitens]|eukprot:GAQ81853.1 hypothetical protein KFL_000920370 [Klebsormidium nitens]